MEGRWEKIDIALFLLICAPIPELKKSLTFPLFAPQK
jgi:hypothetical protein